MSRLASNAKAYGHQTSSGSAVYCDFRKNQIKHFADAIFAISCNFSVARVKWYVHMCPKLRMNHQDMSYNFNWISKHLFMFDFFIFHMPCTLYSIFDTIFCPKNVSNQANFSFVLFGTSNSIGKNATNCRIQYILKRMDICFLERKIEDKKCKWRNLTIKLQSHWTGIYFLM